ncbi:chypothetical protein, conserved, putative [Eimeria praecox]|uniref:SET domain-containing protein n=1 Tax=Eimeria praecox TaxID=51316 RepID=U6H2D2_9EIME|nr:chypothetical protein, conserved, putative [Eimeria praecox]
MKEEGGRTAASPSAAASSSPTASQENDQAQANAAAAPHGVTTKPQDDVNASQYAAGYGRRKGGAGGARGSLLKGRSKHRPAQGVGGSGSGAAVCSKFVSPEAVLSAAREVKDSLPQLSPELLTSLKARGLEPCTLREVLEERGIDWAATQVRDERAESEHARLLEAFQRQCEGWGNNREGWVHSKWHSVIVCPDFKRGGLQVSRSSMREMWNSIMSVVHGFVDPDLVVCRVTDPTHPVRFATPPGESCYTVVYAGKEPIKASRERRILGEYTGHVRAGSTNKQRFEYVFDLSFCALAWRAAEEFEKDSDSSGDEGSPIPEKAPPPAPSEPTGSGRKKGLKKDEADPANNEGVRRVQVTGSSNIERVALPVRGELVLDSHDACNQMSLVNHYGTIGLLGEKICHCNTEWQQVFVDGWPHIVLTTIPGVAIEPGEEVLADFGYDWFNRVQDASHKAIARELLDYRIGAKAGACQALAPARNAECLVRDNDVALQTRARMGEVCPYCHSDEIPVVPVTSSKTAVKVADSGGRQAAAGKQGTGQRPQKTQAQGKLDIQATSEAGSQQTVPIWGEQVVHCDGCDRPCHLRCIFGAHGANRSHTEQEQDQQQPEQSGREQNQQQQCLEGQTLREEEQQPQDNRQEGQQQRKEPVEHFEQDLQGGATASFQEHQGPFIPSGGSNDASNGIPKATQPCPQFGVITGGETVDDVYRWFVEGDCKWFCCVCRLQWERMATAMNFSVDWRARKVLSEGNPLLLPCSSDAGTRGLAAPKAQMTQVEQLNSPYASYHTTVQDVSSASGTKRRGCGRRGSGLSAHYKRSKRAMTESTASNFSRSVKRVFGSSALQGCHQEKSLSATSGGHDSPQETGGSASQDNSAEGSGYATRVASAAAEPCIAETKPPSSDTLIVTGKESESVPGCEADSKTSVPREKLTEAVPLMKSEELPQDPAEYRETRPGVMKDYFGTAPSLPIGRGSLSSECKPSRAGPSTGSDGDDAVEKKHADGLVIEEAMRVYRNSSEKRQSSKMQPCPVALTPEEYSSEELLGCRTDMLVEPRALLGSLQPCVHCYKLYGAKASVEVCRLTKRHLASNWDHPHFASPAQIQDALLTCFQDALLTVQREHQQKLQRLFDNMTPLQRGASMNTLIGGSRQPRIHESAARRSAESMQKPQVHDTETVWKGSIPLLCVTLGKTRVDYQFPDGPSKKKWYYGVVSNYQAISSKVADAGTERSGEGNKEDEKEKKITYYTNQFRIDYDDGDFQTVPPHELIEMLIETGPGSKLDGRKAITTTPLVKMLSPELKRANRQVNQLVRETNRKGCVAESDSDEE